MGKDLFFARNIHEAVTRPLLTPPSPSLAAALSFRVSFFRPPKLVAIFCCQIARGILPVFSSCSPRTVNRLAAQNDRMAQMKREKRNPGPSFEIRV